MKLVSSGSRGKRIADKKNDTGAHAVSGGNTAKKRMSGKKKAIIIVCSILGLIILLIAATFAVVRWEVQPFYDIFFPRPDEIKLAVPRTPRPGQDENDPNTLPGTDLQNPNRTPAADDRPIDQIRNVNKITFLILGVDGYKNLRSEGGANTDVIMIASFDMDAPSVEVVSIPRDMLVNVPWNIRKINSIWASSLSIRRGEDNYTDLAMDDTKEYYADFLGFNIDFWVMLDMEAFITLVDALPAGGVRFDVPRDMHLEDPDIDMDIYLTAGEQLLDGRKALAFVRNRSYAGGDFTRIENQQLFLKAAAEQMLSRSESIDISTYAEVFLKYVKTDIDLNNLIRIARELLKLDSAQINFSTAPSELYGISSGRGASSYVRVLLDEWLEMVNTKLNPFYYEVTPQHVSILTLNENRRLYVTDGHWQGSANWPN